MSFVANFAKKTVAKAMDLFSTNFDNIQVSQALKSPDSSVVIAAIKHILANMTIGKDMSGHFNEVAKLVSSQNFEIKRLVYLYLMQNCKSDNSSKVVLFSGVFTRDTLHESPLIRGIALRTMSSLQVPAMVDFSLGATIRCLSDSDPYVKRNACVAVLKIVRVNPNLLSSEPAIMRKLIELLSDSVATVVASAACTLVELLQAQQMREQQQNTNNNNNSNSTNNTILNTLTSHCDTLLAGLAEATEWSQVYLLQALTCIFKPPKTQAEQLARPPPKSPSEAETLITRVTPLLQSSNPAVVIGACRLLVNLLLTFSPTIPGIKSPLNTVQQATFERTIAQKIAGPLVSMLSGLRFEVRYVALRSIKALLHRMKDAFVPFITQFFVKFDDPIYIKLEKIDIMLAIATRANAELVLAEFAEYSQEVDVEVVRRSVRSIGVLAVRVSSVTPQCVERLIILIESKVNFVVQEAAIVVQQILRQNPTSYEGVIGKLTGALKVLDEPESKSAVVWVLGEYSGRRIANAAEILSVFLENFTEETPLVQRAILTASMKVYLTEPVGGAEKQKLLEQVFGLCTKSSIPDLKDRAMFYWRLLRADPQAAQRVVCGKREPIVDSGFLIQDRHLLSSVLSDLGTLSSVCMKYPRSLFGDGLGTSTADHGNHVEFEEADNAIPSSHGKNQQEEDKKHHHQQHVDPSSSTSTSASVSTKMIQVLDPNQHKGFGISAAWFPGNSAIAAPSLKLKFSFSPSSASSEQLKNIKIDLLQLNGNAFGFGLARDFSSPFELSSTQQQKQHHELEFEINANNAKKPTTEIQVAVRTDPLGVLFFNAPAVPLESALNPALPPGYDANSYAQDFSQLTVAWALPTSGQQQHKSDQKLVSENSLQIHRLTLIHRNDQPPLAGLHVFASTANGSKLFCEITLENDVIVLLNVKSDEVSLAEAFGKYVLKTISV